MLLEDKKVVSGDVDELVNITQHYLKYLLGKEPDSATTDDYYTAISLAIRQYATDRLLATETRYRDKKAKRVYYLSMEFLIGRLLGNNLCNIGLYDLCEQATKKLGINLQDVIESEPDPALGNGGLGRLAACFLDSLATLDMPGFGYGINYEFGLFKQGFTNGHQREKPDHWLGNSTPWQIEHNDDAVMVPLYGKVIHELDKEGNYNPMWMDWQVIIGVPCDMPVVGYGGKTVNYLRLYSARSSNEFDMSIFNEGDYIRAVESKISSENISKVLYPSDSFDAGKELRLIQEYFFVTCAIRDIIRKHLNENENINNLPDKVAIQLNDTHPALAVAELVRTLVDEQDLPWDDAWALSRKTLSYTNHTLLPEALEKWPVDLLAKVLPRHLEIIYEINYRFLNEVKARFPNDQACIEKMSIIEEGDVREVRMANLAIVGSHSVNGVAALHSELVKQDLVPEFYQMWPERFNNKTNGVTQRRWLLKSNPELSGLITETIGDGWIRDLSQLKKLEEHATKKEFKKQFREIKHNNKKALADYIYKTCLISVNPDSLFDVQIKRIHEYKRQLLNAMYIIHSYLRLVEDGVKPAAPRTWVFAGKAAPGYYMAKGIIKLINNLGEVINNDPVASEYFKVAFVPDYKVSVAEKIIPAADLSEQISTAGFEASGTGNMKLALNGALTIGTLDGANVEIMEEVGEDNIYIFGLKTDEVAALRQDGSYSPWDYYNEHPHIKRIMDSLVSDWFCPNESNMFRPIFENILNGGDYYLHLADLNAYIETQEQVAKDFKSPNKWSKKAILNVARTGKFSSDRTISQYAEDIWGVKSIR